MNEGRNSIAEGYFVSFIPPGQKLIADNIHCDLIKKVVRSEAPGGYTLLFSGGEALVSGTQVQLKVLKPFLMTKVCMCMCMCMCMCVFVSVCVSRVVSFVCMCACVRVRIFYLVWCDPTNASSLYVLSS